MSHRPRLLLTRDSEGCAQWAERLVELGADPVVMPCLDIVPADDPQVGDRLVEALRDARWLALTSPRGVDAVVELLAERRAELPETVSLAVVGPASAERARRSFGRVDLMSSRVTSASLAEALWRRERAEAGPIVLAIADRGRREFETWFRSRDVEVRRVEVYSTRPATPDSARDLPDLDRVDGVFFASPSAVRGWLNLIDQPIDRPLVTLGPTTSAAVREAGLPVAAEAERPTIEALFDAFLGLSA